MGNVKKQLSDYWELSNQKVPSFDLASTKKAFRETGSEGKKSFQSLEVKHFKRLSGPSVKEIPNPTEIFTSIKSKFFSELPVNKNSPKASKKAFELCPQSARTHTKKPKFKALKINLDSDIKQEIEKSQIRLSSCRAGKNSISTLNNPNFKRSQQTSAKKKSIKEKLKKRENQEVIRNMRKSLDSFKDISLLAGTFETETSPTKRIFSKTPKKELRTRRVSSMDTSYQSSKQRPRESTEYLKNMHLMGQKGKFLLLKIIEDEKKNVKTSREEKQSLRLLVERNMRKKSQEKETLENQRIKQLASSFLEGEVKSSTLISKFFSPSS